MKTLLQEKRVMVWAGCRKGNSTFYVSCSVLDEPSPRPSGAAAERHSFLQYALLHFRDFYSRSKGDRVKFLTWKKNRCASEWTWKELTDSVKYSPFPLASSLLKLESDALNRLAVDAFKAIMRYIGDLPMGGGETEVECVYSILVVCHHHSALRDEIVCQLIKQTTNNKSLNPESRIRGWRLLSFFLSFFRCSDSLMPYLNKYLNAAAQDRRRMEQGTAEVCLSNLHQTVRYGGRKNVPAETEVHSVTIGQLSRRQDYFLPGGVRVVLPTTSSTVVGDIVRSICREMRITGEKESAEFSLYCIVEGDGCTLPLEREEYVLDLIAELERSRSEYYLVFCRSAWCCALRLDSELYIEVIFHQVIPDYLEGFLTTLPCTSETLEEIRRIAHLLHRANGMNEAPTEFELIHLVPKSVLGRELLECDPFLWDQVTALNGTEAKAQCLELLQKWTLFGSCFFGVRVSGEESEEEVQHLLAVNKSGINVLHYNTHAILWRFSFSAVSFPSVTEMELGDEHFKKVVRLQADHAHEIGRLIQLHASVGGEDTVPKVTIKV